MKFRIVTDGTGQYKVFNKFLWWWESHLPEYGTEEECKRAIFRVWGKVPQDIKVENLNSTQQTHTG